VFVSKSKTAFSVVTRPMARRLSGREDVEAAIPIAEASMTTEMRIAYKGFRCFIQNLLCHRKRGGRMSVNYLSSAIHLVHRRYQVVERCDLVADAIGDPLRR
jgi:hypothetical protein